MKVIQKYEIKMEHGLVAFEPTIPSPVIISVPHDGLAFQAFMGLCKPRKLGSGSRDLNTWPIAQDILASVQVNALRGLMPRAMVDYNRAWPQGINYYPNSQTEIHTALDDVALLPAYHYYHTMLDYFLSRAAERFGIENVLLIDIHGFKNQPPYAPAGGYDMILGTANKKNILHGDVDERFASHMAGLGYSIFLPQIAEVGAKEDCFVANYITQHHSARHRVNAIQIEVSSRFRLPENREIRKNLSGDIAEFIRKYSM